MKQEVRISYGSVAKDAPRFHAFALISAPIPIPVYGEGSTEAEAIAMWKANYRKKMKEEHTRASYPRTVVVRV